MKAGLHNFLHAEHLYEPENELYHRLIILDNLLQNKMIILDMDVLHREGHSVQLPVLAHIKILRENVNDFIRHIEMELAGFFLWSMREKSPKTRAFWWHIPV